MKRRADELLVEQGLAPTRSKARALIMAGQVRAGDQVVDKAGTTLDPGIELRVDQGPRYVSRGGEKLRRALDVFQVDPSGMICADFGASTGGFTDALLQAGASRVYAVDVGYGQLDYSLRSDSRVVVLERTNVRYLQTLPETVDLVAIDVSFISLGLIFPVVKKVLKANSGICIALVKPQFEAGRDQVGKGGVVRDSRIHRLVLHNTIEHAEHAGLTARDVTDSPITGPKGNREFLMLLGQSGIPSKDLNRKIEQALLPGEPPEERRE